MASSSFVLRFKSAKGQYTIDTLKDDSTVAELKNVLKEVIGINVDSLRILLGFPPKLLNIDNDSMKLSELNISSGETLIIEETKSETPAENMPIAAGSSATESGDTTQPGILIRHVVPANNSCLFSSIYFIVSQGDSDLTNSKGLRQIISDIVENDPEKYNEAFLGMPNKQYCSWIQNEDHWGGAIELSIMSEYYGLEIVAVDTLSMKCLRFGENNNYEHRIFLIYDGIHYDPLVMERLDGSRDLQTFFDVEDENVLEMAMEIAKEAHSARQYTDIKNFSLKCLKCNKSLRGDKEAREHALNTRHCDFGEV